LKIKTKQTAHNRTVAASGAGAPSGFGRLGHGYAIPTPPSPKFGRHATLRVALKCRPNVSYSHNVRRQFKHRINDKLLSVVIFDKISLTNLTTYFKKGKIISKGETNVLCK